MNYVDNARIADLISEAEAAIERLELKKENAEEGYGKWTSEDSDALSFWWNRLHSVVLRPAQALIADAKLGELSFE